MTKSFQFADALLARSILLHRVASKIVAEIDSEFPKLRLDIIGSVSSGFLSVHSLIPSITVSFDRMERSLSDNLLFVYRSETDYVQKLIGSLLGHPVLLSSATSLSQPPILGASFASHFQKFKDDLLFKTLAAVRVLLSNPEPPSVDRDFLLKEFTATVSGIDSLVRTAFAQIQNHCVSSAVKVLYEDCNLIQLSVLDNRTTDVCRDYSDQQWNRDYFPVGHDMPFNGGPPRHWNCRSVLSLVFPGEKFEGFNLQSWLDQKHDSDIEKIFGASQFRLYSKGLIPLSALVRQSTRPVSLDSLTKIQH